MRISYEYKVFLNSPKATEYSKQREQSTSYLLFLALPLNLMAILIYVPSVLLFPTEADWGFLVFGLSFVILCGFFTFYMIVRRPLVTEMNLAIILDREQVTPLPEPLRKDDYAQLRTALKQHILKVAKSASIYFFCGLGIITEALWAIVFLKKGYGYVSSSIIAVLAVTVLVVLVILYGIKTKRKKEEAEVVVHSLYQEMLKIRNDARQKAKVWECPECGSRNNISSISCKDCGRYK